MCLELGRGGFLRLLISSFTSKIINQKWRIQYGGQNWKIFTYFSETWYYGVFVVVDFEFNVKNYKLKMADLICHSYYQNFVQICMKVGKRGLQGSLISRVISK